MSWLIYPLALAAGVAAGATTVIAPLSIPPSQYFDGDDGRWSSFQIQVGTPAQTVRLYPGTSACAGTTIWVVLAEGCWQANPGLPNCANERGYTFTRNASSSWSTQRLPNGGLYNLDTFEENYLGLTGAGYYGFDTVNLGIAGQNMPTLENQLVTGIATNNYWLGSLPLSPTPFNITNLDDPIPSLLGTLRNRSLVPSSSWAYTAGAAYKDPVVYGSLTFGGYDTTRLDPQHTLSNISFNSDTSRDLVVRLNAITYDTLGSTPLLTQSIPMYIDSMVTQLWLPTEVCQNFEKAFNLTWNANASLYLIDETVHNALLNQNPSISFSFGGNSQPVEIVLPYAAFDLNVTWPIANGQTRYFPLQRAQNSSQYTLGRVFLQEAYVIADYDRSNFTVGQALFPSTSEAQHLVPICAPGEEEACYGAKSGLNKGAIAGIAIGIVILLCLVAVGAWLSWRRRKQRPPLPPTALSQPEYSSHDYQPEKIPGQELDAGVSQRHEMDQSNGVRPELGSGKNDVKYEMMHHWTPHEMGVGEPAAVELEAPIK